MNFIEDDEYMDEIPKCPKCGEILEIVIRGMHADLKEEMKKGFEFYFAGCLISGLEKTDYICRNCAREFDKYMNEINVCDFEYLTIDQVISKRGEKLNK